MATRTKSIYVHRQTVVEGMAIRLNLFSDIPIVDLETIEGVISVQSMMETNGYLVIVIDPRWEDIDEIIAELEAMQEKIDKAAAQTISPSQE